MSYDSKAYIRTSLGSLEDFHDLLDERAHAARLSDVPLQEFVVLGRYRLDGRGQMSMYSADGNYGFIPKERFPDIADVLTAEEFRRYVTSKSGDDESIQLVEYLMGGKYCLAPTDVPCAMCEQHWDLANAHDCTAQVELVVVDLHDWVGQRLSSFRAEVLQQKDALYRFNTEMVIRNDSFIDLTPKPPGNSYGGVVNKYGWIDGDIVADDYTIQPGDETSHFVSRFYHDACRRNKLAAERQSEFSTLFELAGFERFRLTAIHNPSGYGEFAGPWFEVGSAYGRISIGWRKRVIVVDWSGSGRNLLHLFEDVGSTKDEDSVHAWTLEEAVDYLRRVRKALEPAEVAADTA